MTAKTLEEEVSLACECYYREKRYITAFEILCFKRGYLAAATLRDKEIEELRAELADWRESARKASGERCEDEIHCCCVPYLRVEIDRLRARVKELEGMVPKWCEWDSDARRDMTKAGYMDSGDDELIGGKWHLLMVPPIPLPGEG